MSVGLGGVCLGGVCPGGCHYLSSTTVADSNKIPCYTPLDFIQTKVVVTPSEV